MNGGVIPLMSLQSAEKRFAKIVESEDEDLIELIAEWCPWFASRRYGSFDEGEEIRNGLRELGIEPTAGVKLSHSRVISLAVEAALKTDVVAAADAFIMSAQNGCAHFQNALRSISIIRNLPKHRFDGDFNCMVCGIQKEQEWYPLNAASSFKDGCAGGDSAWLDNLMTVRWFNRSVHSEPSRSEISSFNKVLKIIDGASPKDTSVKIAKVLKNEMGGDIYSWRYFFDTLGFAGVLKTGVHPGNLQAWTNFCDRDFGPARSDVASPCCFWRRSMGFDRDVFASLFQNIKLPRGLQQ